MKIIAVGSQNPAKLEAVKSAFQKVWPDEEWNVVGTDVKSGVSDQPMTDIESIQGAINRAERALAATPNATYGVGLEGGIQQINDHYYDCGWAVVVDNTGQEGIGSSVRMEVPARVMELVLQGTELGFADDQVFGQEMSKHSLGHFGLMTNGALTRTEAYRDGIVAALSHFLHPGLF